MSLRIRIAEALHTAAQRARRYARRRHQGLLGCVMMVKDEAASIEATIASVKPYVDAWLLLDTGSTDGTDRLAERAWQGVPGRIERAPFVDFATTRNRAFELFDEACVFSLVLSGDETLKNGAALRAFCEDERRGTDGAYNVLVELGDQSFLSTRLARTAAGWRYFGAVHEVLAPPDMTAARVRAVPEVVVAHDIAAHDVGEARLLRDKRLLEKDFASGKGTSNTWYYYGQTLEALDDVHGALAAYETRLSIPGCRKEETFLVMMRIAACLVELGRARDGEARYLAAHEHSPTRAEPLYALAWSLLSRGEQSEAHAYAVRAAALPVPSLSDGIVVDRALYGWKRLDLLSTTAFHVGDKALAKDAAERALEDDVPREAREVIARRLAMLGGP